MEDFFYAVGFLLRLPLFLLGVTLVTLIVIPLALLGSLLSIILIPFVFLRAAFHNDKAIFANHVNQIFKWFSFARDAYKDLKEWLYKKR